MTAVAMSPPSDGELKKEQEQVDIKPALTPPSSENTDKKEDDSGSELSELEPEEPSFEPKAEEDDDIVPDHFYEGGKVPVFKPTMDQFRSFKDFMRKIDKYGMKSGIVKVVPPKEWRENLPPLDEQVKTIKVKNPITQEFHGTHGTYTQANIEKQRSYNLPQWKALSEESSHQPPAKRGERRRNQERTTRISSARVRNPPASSGGGKKRGVGRPRVRQLPATIQNHEEGDGENMDDTKAEAPLTPTSPALKPSSKSKEHFGGDEEEVKPKGRQPKSEQAKSVSSRRQHNRRDQTEVIDEEAFKDFDYRVYNQGEWTKERVQELETAYWKSLNFSNPMYGADMPGSLFDDSTTDWNVAKLENLLDVLGQKVPGVNTAYLYLGMWKASFAWHLEDVDLYSINYIHFGAPKQWYSISQEDARRFEAAMRSVWPNDAKNCDQFLRHKTYLISPQLLQSQYNIRVNRLVHNEGEFVITFPYGYHSGYNLGYNCAESVNFATESWLDYGRVARKCNCEADSVWVDVREIERKLRGEPTPEYYEETEEDEDEDDDEDEPTDLPTPPGSDKGKPKRSHKKKIVPDDKDAKPKIKKLRIKIRAPSYEPCVLCPNDHRYEKLLPTDNGHQAHRRCALYTPETYISEEHGSETVCDVARIDKARLELKCNYCRNKKGSVFQCSQKKCTRAYHATCAASAGVLVDIGLVPVFGEDGTEYTDTGIDFRCRFHRGRRGKHVDGAALEESSLIRKYALKVPVGEVVQMQYLQGDIFAGVVLENRKSEQTLLVGVLPKGDKVEVEYKWLLVFDPINSQLPMPSELAKPLPAELARKSRTTAEDPANNDDPKPNEPFCDPASKFRWEEFNTCKALRNPAQVKVDLSKSKSFWFYLGKPSTEAKAHYTGDLAQQRNDPSANFLDSVRIASAAASRPPVQRRSYPASHPFGINQNALNAARANVLRQQARAQHYPDPQPPVVKDRPYHGKYAIPDSVSSQCQPKPGVNVDSQALRNQRAFQQAGSTSSQAQYHSRHNPGQQIPSYQSSQVPMASMAPTAPMTSVHQQRTTPQVRNPAQYNVRDYLAEISKPPVNTPRQFTPSYPQVQYLQQQHQQSLQQPRIPPYLKPQAPIANMMIGAPAASISTSNNPKPLSRRSSVERRLSTTSVALTQDILVPPTQETKKVSHLNVKEKYNYLHDAEKARPQIYQSPYALEGGFTPAYLPIPTETLKTRPRGLSMSEDYLLKRTLSEQEQVNRKLSEEKAKIQQEQQQKEAQRRSPSHSRSHSLQPRCQHEQQIQHLPMSAIQQPQLHQPSSPQAHPSQNYYEPNSVSYQQYNHYSPSYATSSLHLQTQAQYYPPSQHQSHQLHSPTVQTHTQQSPIYQSFQQSHQSPGGLQFQSPQDFQLEMQREAQQSPNGFENFFRGMQSAAHTMPGVGIGYGSASYSSGGNYGSGGGGQGSPLKYEFGSGGAEMLPMMRDPSRY